MKITHLSTYDIRGGASRSAYRLHEGLRRLGHESRLLVQYPESHKPGVIGFAPPLELRTRSRRIFRRYFLRYSRKFHYSRRPTDGYYFNDDRSEHSADVLRQLPASDILNLHWVAGLLDYSPFFNQLPGGMPVVWTLHDMNPITGGCHHADDCGKFRQRCAACPQLGSSSPNDFSTAIWQRKHAAYGRLAKNRVRIVTPSRWLAKEVGESALMREFSVKVIPYGLDTDCFKPRERETARELFEIPREARVVLFVSHLLADKYKGGPMLMEAINRLKDVPDLFLFILGDGKWPDASPVPSKVLPFMSNERFISFAYNAANVLVLPTLMDNLPNTALEALACGIPTIAFNVGGVPEIVRHGCTGLLVERGDSEGLAMAIKTLISDSGLQQRMSANCRRIALEEYDLQVQARRYAELYTSLLN